MEIDFLQVYLQHIPPFGKTEHDEDAVIIKIIDGQPSMSLSKKSRTTDFLQSIHIGVLLHKKAKKQNMTEEFLSEILPYTQDTISRMFNNPDIDTERLIWMSYALNYDFLRNVYLPYICVNKPEITDNNSITDFRSIKTISVITNDETIIYHKFS
jgi:hypothetical protein